MSNTTVDQICRTSYPVVAAETSVRETADTMRRHGLRWLPVTCGGAIVGLVSVWDIIRKAVAGGMDQNATSVEAIMRIGLPACPADAGLDQAIRVMKQKHTRQVAVVAGGPEPVVVGIVTAEDILRAIDPTELDAEFYLAAFS